MPVRVLEFRLGRPEILDDLLHEFGLDTDASASVRDGVLVVQTSDTASAAWSVRATVRSFDESAVEL